jgi:hypothetical protein
MHVKDICLPHCQSLWQVLAHRYPLLGHNSDARKIPLLDVDKAIYSNDISCDHHRYSNEGDDQVQASISRSTHLD